MNTPQVTTPEAKSQRRCLYGVWNSPCGNYPDFDGSVSRSGNYEVTIWHKCNAGDIVIMSLQKQQQMKNTKTERTRQAKLQCTAHFTAFHHR